MPPLLHDRGVSDARSLLGSTGTPFATVSYQPRACVFLEGDSARTMMYIESGLVELVVTSADGKEAICGVLGPGAFLGDDVLAGHAARRQTATAMTKTGMLVVSATRMLQLIRTQPAVSDQFIAHLLARNTRLTADLTAQLLESSRRRLARKLIELAGCDEQHPSECALPLVSQAIIAEMVGTTRSRVSLLMSGFKHRGGIARHGHQVVITPTLWLELAYDGDRSDLDEAPQAASRRYRQSEYPGLGPRPTLAEGGSGDLVQDTL